MTDSSASPSSRLLVQALEEKVTLLISQSLVISLEIAQLQQENSRLMSRLGDQKIPTTNLNYP
ncbi:MAG: hypothetical protein ACKVJ2_04690 [Pseudomonadales bacterium]|jgi:hypothetical protein